MAVAMCCCLFVSIRIRVFRWYLLYCRWHGSRFVIGGRINYHRSYVRKLSLYHDMHCLEHMDLVRERAKTLWYM